MKDRKNMYLLLLVGALLNSSQSLSILIPKKGQRRIELRNATQKLEAATGKDAISAAMQNVLDVRQTIKQDIRNKRLKQSEIASQLQESRKSILKKSAEAIGIEKPSEFLGTEVTQEFLQKDIQEQAYFLIQKAQDLLNTPIGAKGQTIIISLFDLREQIVSLQSRHRLFFSKHPDIDKKLNELNQKIVDKMLEQKREGQAEQAPPLPPRPKTGSGAIVSPATQPKLEENDPRYGGVVLKPATDRPVPSEPTKPRIEKPKTLEEIEKEKENERLRKLREARRRAVASDSDSEEEEYWSDEDESPEEGISSKPHHVPPAPPAPPVKTQEPEIERPHPQPGRAELLEQIRQGTELKKAGPSESAPEKPEKEKGLLGALQSAIEEKREQSLPSSDEDDEDGWEE